MEDILEFLAKLNILDEHLLSLFFLIIPNNLLFYPYPYKSATISPSSSYSSLDDVLKVDLPSDYLSTVIIILNNYN